MTEHRAGVAQSERSASSREVAGASPAPRSTRVCPWCDRSYTTRSKAGTRGAGGTEQRFCSAPCRLAYHVAARRLGQALVESGEVSFATLRRFEAGELVKIQATLSTRRGDDAGDIFG